METAVERMRGRGRWVTRAGLIVAVAGLLATDQAHLRPRAWAADLEGANGPQVLIGRDNDNVNNPVIQPPDVPSPPGPNQSLNNTDILRSGAGNDVLIGLLGSDVMDGGPGDDIFIGGPEGGPGGGAPNSDVQLGGPGRDIAIWAPGDGSDAFIGGPHEDALVIGLIDRDPNDPAGRLPLLSNPVPRFPHGVPGVNISGTSGTCTLERVTDPDLGFEFLVRFFGGNGALAVTIRLSEVEQVFCPDGQGGIVFADLTVREPEFTLVASDRLVRLNRNVALISR
jgi:hypothetical protein